MKKMPDSEVDKYVLHMLKIDLYQCALSDGFDVEVKLFYMNLSND